jgi:hypothetical protein
MQQEEKIYRNVPTELQYIARFVKLMDSSIKIPGTDRTIGLDPLLGLIPVVGEFFDLILSSIIMLILMRHGSSGKVKAKMLLNVGIDALLMMIPFAGNIIDFFFKANQRNLKLALEHYEEGKHQGSAWPVLLPVIAGALFIIIVTMTVTIWLLTQVIQLIAGLF